MAAPDECIAVARQQVPRALMGPRWWPLWLVLGLMWMLTRLPLPWLLDFGAALGAIFGRLAGRRRGIVRINLQMCFPLNTAAETEILVTGHFRALGMGLFETMLAGMASDRKLEPYLDTVGLEHLDAAHADGCGVLLLTGHFTTMEMGARAICVAQRPFHAMYRPLKNKLVDYWITRWHENESQRAAVPKEDLKRLLRVLRQGGAIWYGPDQTIESPAAAFVPFFGVPTLTLTATSRLAQMGRARVVPFYPQRIDGRYRLTFLPALDNFPSGDDLADTCRISGLLETAVMRCPEQYFWIHRRFKYRPVGDKDVYKRHIT